jgi:hypothetical protein
MSRDDQEMEQQTEAAQGKQAQWIEVDHGQ